MRISIESNHIEVSESLNETIKLKVGKLEHFYENIVDAIVYLRNGGMEKEIEIKVVVKNDVLFVEDKGETYQAALDTALEKMKRQIVKYKETTLKNL